MKKIYITPKVEIVKYDIYAPILETKTGAVPSEGEEAGAKAVEDFSTWGDLWH